MVRLGMGCGRDGSPPGVTTAEMRARRPSSLRRSKPDQVRRVSATPAPR
ncbi:hypothetical protein C882_2197 [Caenispirillum salinarum AK4]|uniref:Uncharacterized protein n=1 Tax=Caenispirillum salinarum AK4 TaxID=1238182 RepID=K9H7X5_9PROT|nr:hypothetical protein C882_2197 [Caenispirillum salinarum AK4]